MICKICNNKSSKKFIKLYIHQNIKYFRCDICDFVFQHPLLSQNKLNIFYDKKYFDNNYKKSKDYDLRKIQYKKDKEIILEFFKDKKNKKVLDFGCGNGEFLSLFKSKKFGYEYNLDAKVNQKITRISKKEVFAKKFDMIIMRGVIEHLPDFDQIVKKLSKCLVKNGLFYITATPNIYNLTFFLSKKDFNQNSPGHLFHFNHVNLSFFFLKNNFLNICTKFEYLNTPYANTKKDFANLKNQLKKMNKKVRTISPPSVGNMLTSVFKKMA